MFAYISAHWDVVVTVVTAVVVIAREVVNFTGKGKATEAEVEAILNKFGLIKPDAQAPADPAAK